MKKVKITVMRRTEYPDLMAQFENPLENACDMTVGQTFVSIDGEQPAGLCDSAWESMAVFVRELAAGGGGFYGNWMRDSHTAMISCNDGFRPVSFYLEAMDGEEQEKIKAAITER